MPERQLVKFYRLSARSCNLAQAARSPACAAAATPATSAPAPPDTAATATAASDTAAAAATATSAAANNNDGYLHVAASPFLIEEMKRGETDVLHFLFAKDEALIRLGVVRLRDISSGHRGSRCNAEQRKTQSGRTEPRHGSGLGCAFLPRSLLDPSHGRILSSCERLA